MVDNSGANRLGFYPQDCAEPFRAMVEARGAPPRRCRPAFAAFDLNGSVRVDWQSDPAFKT
jgi:hypothetical protein